MKLPKVSVGTLMVVLFVVAIDCVIYRSFQARSYTHFGNQLRFDVLSTLPVANILAIATAALVSSPARRSGGRLGFAIGALLAVVATIPGLKPALDAVEWLVYRAGFAAWLESSTVGEWIAFVFVVVVLPALFQVAAGVIAARAGRAFAARRAPRVADESNERRHPLAALVTLAVLAAAPAVAVEWIMRRDVDPIFARLAIGQEAEVDLTHPLAAILLPKNSPFWKLASTKVRVLKDQEPFVLQAVQVSNTASIEYMDSRPVRVAIVDGSTAGDSTSVPHFLLRQARSLK